MRPESKTTPDNPDSKQDQKQTTTLSDVELGALQKRLEEVDNEAHDEAAREVNEQDATRELDVRAHLPEVAPRFLSAEGDEDTANDDNALSEGSEEGKESDEDDRAHIAHRGDETEHTGIATELLDQDQIDNLLADAKARAADRDRAQDKELHSAESRGTQTSTTRVSPGELRKIQAAAEELTPIGAPIRKKPTPMSTQQIKRIERHGTPRAELLGEQRVELVIPTELGAAEISTELEIEPHIPTSAGISGSGATFTQSYEKPKRLLEKEQRERKLAKARPAESRTPQEDVTTSRVAKPEKNDEPSPQASTPTTSNRTFIIGLMVVLGLLINAIIMVLK